MKRIIAALMTAASPALVLAHEGHGSENPLGPYHYLVNAEHLIPLVLAIVTGVVLVNWLVYRLRKRTEKK
jgi:hypothetical protein